MSLPDDKLCIIITTYDSGDGKRILLAKRTIESLLKNLEYPNLHWIISDDSSQENHCKNKNTFNELLPNNLTIFNTMRKGVGFSKNTSLNYAFSISPFCLLLEDDWILNSRFTALDYLVILQDYHKVGMIRLGYLGGSMDASLEQFGPITFWNLKQGSGVYVYSGQVSLRHRRFYEKVGYHDEGVSAGQEELMMCKRYNGVKDAPMILWPANIPSTLNSGIFQNIGMDNSTNSVNPS